MTLFLTKNLLFMTIEQVCHRSDMKQISTTVSILFVFNCFLCRTLGKIAINVIDWTVACIVSLLCLHCSQVRQWQIVGLYPSVVNISKYKLFVLTRPETDLSGKTEKLENFLHSQVELGSFFPSPPLSSISYLFKFNLVISYSKHLYNQRQRASWRDISDTSPPNFVGKLIFIIDDGGL